MPTKTIAPAARKGSRTAPGATSTPKKSVFAGGFGRKALLWGAFLAAAATLGMWGVLNHPWYKERVYAPMPLNQLVSLKERYPNDPTLLYFLGKRLNEQNRLLEAIPILERAASLDSGSPRVREEWAHAQVGSGRLNDAYKQLKEFVQSHPESAQGHLLLGKFYLSAQRDERARKELEAAARLEPTSGEIWYFLARARFVADPNAARDAIQKSVALAPDNADAYLTQAAILTRRGTAFEVRGAYQKALALAPKRADINQLYAQWLLTHLSEKDDLDMAERCARIAAQSEPNDGEAQLTLGRALSRNGKFSEAVTPLEKAFQFLPNDPFVARELSQVFEKIQQLALAEKAQREYVSRLAYKTEVDRLLGDITLHPKDFSLHRQLAALYGKHGEVQKCLTYAAAGRQSSLDAPDALTAAAEALASGGHYPPALAFAQRAADLQPDKAATQEVLADVLMRSGRLTEGMAAYEKTQQLDPARVPSIRAKLQRLYAEKSQKPQGGTTK
jgi:tetratricopeptide (TPR) repeat protein